MRGSRALRGGSWFAGSVRSAYRDDHHRSYVWSVNGFRLILKENRH